MPKSFVLVLLTLFLASCSAPPTPNPTPNPPPTEVPTQTSAPTATVVPSATTVPTQTNTPAPTETSAPTPTSTPAGPNVPAAFLQDVSEPLQAAIAQTAFTAGQVFASFGNNVGYSFAFMVYDLWAEDIPIETISGEELATAKISAIALYPRPDGEIDWVLVPLLIERPDGKWVEFGGKVLDELPSGDIQGQVEAYRSEDNWVRGAIGLIQFSHRPEAAYADPSQVFQLNTDSATIDIVTNYGAGRENEMTDLVQTGNSNDHMLVLPLSVDRNIERLLVELP